MTKDKNGNKHYLSLNKRGDRLFYMFLKPLLFQHVKENSRRRGVSASLYIRSLINRALDQDKEYHQYINNQQEVL